MVNKLPIRVRFAPSPTGALHVGGARTALFNWLFARSNSGTFILRIEDTDRNRYDEKAEAAMIADLKWLGLEWDEGVEIGGEFGPYRQSHRLHSYLQKAGRLIEADSAYTCFCSPERLEIVRKTQRQNKQKIGYDRHCRELSKEESAKRLAAGEKHVIRFKVPLEGETSFTDALRGIISYQNAELDDFIIIKSDGYPSYHLANVLDDYAMGITHVLRGDEWIPSTPKHFLIYKALGWNPPVFCHLPVILAPGGGKLSKRKGAASVADYRRLGYLPDAMVNFLALLGWNPGEDKEIMTRSQLIKNFDIKRIHPKSCAFDEKKLEWMNGQYIMLTESRALLPEIKTLYDLAGVSLEGYEDGYIIAMIDLLKERCRHVPDFLNRGRFFFEDPQEYNVKAGKKHFNESTSELLRNLRDRLDNLPAFKAGDLEHAYRSMAESMELPNAAALIHPTRMAISGMSAGPGLFQVLELLGREVVVRRLSRAEDYLKGASSIYPKKE